MANQVDPVTAQQAFAPRDTAPLPAKGRRHDLTALLIGAIVVLTAGLAALQPESSGDVWHHIKSGWLVAQKGGPARADVFSCTAVGQPWIQYEWLAQLCIYETHALGGVAALVLLRAGLVAATALLLFMACRARGRIGPFASAVAVMLTVFALSGRFFTRPELFTWVLFAGWLLGVEHLRNGRRWCAVLPALLMIPWVNMHGAWPAGLVWLTLVAAGETASFLLKRSRALPPATIRTLWLALGLAMAATLVNPYGFHIWDVPFKLTLAPEVQRVIGEWQRPGWAHWTDPLHVGAWVLLAVVLASPFELGLPGALVVIVFGALALTARRHIALTMLVTTPVLAGQLCFLWHGAVNRWRRLARCERAGMRIAATVLLCAVLGTIALGGRIRINEAGILTQAPRLGLGLDESQYPIGATRFMLANHLEGNLFNSYAFGNYLLYALYPQNHVFIDGRVDMYGAYPLRLYDDVRRAAMGWQAILRARDIEIAIIETQRTVEAGLLDALQASTDWALVYWDDNTAVYVQRTPRHAEFLKHAYVYAIRSDGMESDLMRTRAGVARAEQDYRMTLRATPDCVRAMQGIAECLRLREDYEGAVELLRKAAELRPYNPTLSYNLGAALLGMGRADEAERWLRNTLRLGGHQTECDLALGTIDQRKGLLDRAQRNYEKALQLAPDNWKAYMNLSILFEGRGQLDKAIAAALAAQRIQPQNRIVNGRVQELLQKKRQGEG